MTVALECKNVDNHSVLVLTIPHSRFVGRTTDCVNPVFVPILSSLNISMLVRTCIHRTAPSTSCQPPCLRTFVRCLELYTKSHSLLCCTFAAIIFQARWLNPIDTSYGFGAALYLTGHSTPVVGARGRPATHCLLWWRGPRILVVRLCGIKLSRAFFNSSWCTHPRLPRSCLYL